MASSTTLRKLCRVERETIKCGIVWDLRKEAKEETAELLMLQVIRSVFCNCISVCPVLIVYSTHLCILTISTAHSLTIPHPFYHWTPLNRRSLVLCSSRTSARLYSVCADDDLTGTVHFCHFLNSSSCPRCWNSRSLKRCLTAPTVPINSMLFWTVSFILLSSLSSFLLSPLTSRSSLR